MTLAGKFGDPKTEKDILSAKRFNFVALLVLIALMAGAFILYLQLIEKQRELEMKSQQLADSTAGLRRIRSELEASQSTLAKREANIEGQLENLSHSVENRDFDSAMVQANLYASQLAYHDSTGLVLAHVYAWKPEKGVLHKINHYLQEPDYMLAKEETLTDLPVWMGVKSAIYFFDPTIKEKAERMAKQFTKLAGTTFVALQGDPGDAHPDPHHAWVRVHYLGGKISARNE